MARMEAVEAAERAGEAFGRIRTEDVQDGMNRWRRTRIAVFSYIICGKITKKGSSLYQIE